LGKFYPSFFILQIKAHTYLGVPFRLITPLKELM
jgi:hypothetical protein